MGVENEVAWKYWKPLSDVFLEFIDHPEAKFEGNMGFCKEGMLSLKGACTLARKLIKLKCRN